jgi:multidrug efflux pump subunit AcrA (membrane-fusion protein)
MRKLLRPRVAIPLAIAAFFLLGGWTLRNKLAADRQGDWVRATRADLVTGIEVVGTLAAVDSGSFGPPQLDDVWDFKISMMAPEGAEVKAGQPILGFDTTELTKRLEQNSAESEQASKEIERRRADLAMRIADEKLGLAEAEARLRKTKLKLQTPSDIEKLTERKQVELDFALAQRETADIRSRIESLEAAARAEIALLESKRQRAATIVDETQKSIAQMTVRSPRAGTVVYVSNWRRGGEKKKVGDTCWKMERVIEIPDLRKMRADGDVDEVDAGKVAVGQRVTLRLDAHPDDEFHGTITRAAKNVAQAQGTKDPLKVLHVEVTLDRTDAAKMRPGMRFKGTVELGRAKRVVLVPRDAVYMVGGKTIVYRRGALSVDEVPVTLGQQNDRQVEVTSGLRANDRVLVAKSGAKDEAKS